MVKAPKRNSEKSKNAKKKMNKLIQSKSGKSAKSGGLVQIVKPETEEKIVQNLETTIRGRNYKALTVQFSKTKFSDLQISEQITNLGNLKKDVKSTIEQKSESRKNVKIFVCTFF